jgi:hypothetical protein
MDAIIGKATGGTLVGNDCVWTFSLVSTDSCTLGFDH